MVKASSSAAAPLLLDLPEDIVAWEILTRLPPRSLLRCRAVCRSWRVATSTRDFLLAHHGRQPSLPIIPSFEYGGSHILAFDHRAATANAQLHSIARFDEALFIAASCDGLLVLTDLGLTETCFSICNPATRQYAPVGRGRDLNILGMYLHHPTGEYRLLLHRSTQRRWVLADLLPEGKIGCYIFALGSGQPPRYIGWRETGSELSLGKPVLIRDSLHWFTVQYQTEKKQLIVFDTIAESFRQMRLPITPTNSGTLLETDGTLGIYTCNIYASEFVDIWVLQNYEREVWDLKYRIKLPVAEIRRRFTGHEYSWDVKVVLGNGNVLLFVNFYCWLLHIDSAGNLISSFCHGSRSLRVSRFRLKQTLVPHTFFPALEGHVVNAPPFI